MLILCHCDNEGRQPQTQPFPACYPAPAHSEIGLGHKRGQRRQTAMKVNVGAVHQLMTDGGRMWTVCGENHIDRDVGPTEAQKKAWRQRPVTLWLSAPPKHMTMRRIGPCRGGLFSRIAA